MMIVIDDWLQLWLLLMLMDYDLNEKDHFGGYHHYDHDGDSDFVHLEVDDDHHHLKHAVVVIVHDSVEKGKNLITI